ncbi:MAG: hypothetical protein OXF96_04955, partial [Chloroflexi bacterium]|nr:hypothetical protein [Chloroflexota bacterium]
MTIDPGVVPGLLLLVAELAALAAVGYVIVRAVLRQDDERMALAQGLVVGPALWGLIVNVVLNVVPGLAGAAIGWGVMLALGAVLVWREPLPIRPRPRLVAGFAVVFLVTLWAALASRQLLTIQDWSIHLGLAASIRAGAFPPELPWNPGMPVRYHHAPALLVGLLAPPIGPDRAFVSELVDVYSWASFTLVMAVAVLRRGSWPAMLLVAPLLLTYGAWTEGRVGHGLLEFPVPTGLPAAGLRASMADIYWPSVVLSQGVHPWERVLPDIWKPAFTLGYALAFVVLERAVRSERRSWSAAMTLAGLVGFIGLLATTLAPAVLALWTGLEAVRVARSRRDGSALARRPGPAHGWFIWVARRFTSGEVVRSGAGLALAALLLLGGGGGLTGFLGGPASGLSIATSLRAEHWTLLGAFDQRPGGVALLGVGPVVVAGVATVLARRDRLVLALAVAAGVCALAYLGLYHAPAPHDLGRVAGHARNLAMMALLLALSTRLAQLRPRWRYAGGALLVGLIAWPTLVAPARYLGLAVGNGIQLANAAALHHESSQPGRPEIVRRYRLPAISEHLATYIQDHTPVNARVLATPPSSAGVFLNTGRPEAAGFVGQIHLQRVFGPEYLDAVHFLEPQAFRRLGLQYIHATDAWQAALPERAARWLNDPRLFELLARDEEEALYRVRPAFPAIDAAPNPASFEALRALPPFLTAYLHPSTSWFARIRIAAVLPDARLVGSLDIGRLHLRTPLWPIEPEGEQLPDLVVVPANVDPWMFPDEWRPIWRNDDAAIYAPQRTVAPNMTLPDHESPPVSVQVTDARLDQSRVTFTASYGERAPERWTSQDWILVRLLESPLGIPVAFLPDERGPAFAKWIDGLLASGSAATTHRYQLDVATSSLAVRSDSGAFVPLPASDGDLGPGAWALVIRLRHEYEPGSWREAAFIPVLRIWV